MENKQYEKLVNSLPEEHRQKVDEAVNLAKNTYINTYSHYVGNMLTGIMASLDWYEQSEKTEKDKKLLTEDITGSLANIKKVANVMRIIPRIEFKDIKFPETVKIDENSIIIPLEEILKE